ncbi:uncharacterized protein LOC131207381 [Anopheles bellator]|uniref:uncharacterized protein LOC131207381 n=1 Tax=Anopheles bellator TaxID=139047 RepID=UPI00264A2AC7|nr:uncharacterized protein LOC131207381 [Anopheles bellator]
MYELDDISTGFHDVLLNKYNMSTAPISDLYITDSMQDMLDIDIKSEVATVVGGVNEFSLLLNHDLMPQLELDSNSLDGGDSFLSSALTTASDLYADVGNCANPNYVMPLASSSVSLSTTSSNTLSTSSSMSALVAAQSLLKSPKQTHSLNLNMLAHGTERDPTLPSPKERKSHLTFSPSTVKVPLMHDARKLSNLTQITRVAGGGGTATTKVPYTAPSTPADSVRKDLSTQMALKEEKIVVRTGMAIKAEPQEPKGHGEAMAAKKVSTTGLGVGLGKGNTIKLAAGIGGLTFANSVQFKNLKSVQKITSIGSLKRSGSPQPAGNGSASPKLYNQSLIIHQGGKPSPGAVASSGMLSPRSPTTTTARQSHKQKLALLIGKGASEFPKPAYSYSCLIAMALKNSRSGSLPVSEIYSFMCQHFPYFKTAPNGWKNSVRHNLSLNKCFEKIEKPAKNGGVRKGCLWAMNPIKISKMDEEVQKWSRKDPLAIRKAMVHPEHLEALERGEMKHGSTSDDDLDPEEDLESDGGPSDVDAEEVDEEVGDPEDAEDEEDEEDEVVELEQPDHDIIDVDAESFIINTPESLIDGDDETGEPLDFDIEVPDFYENINVDSKDGSLAMELTQQDLLTLEDEDESLYINQSHLQQQPQLVHRLPQQQQIVRQAQIVTQHRQQQHQPPAKRARLDVSYTHAPAHKTTLVSSGGNGVVNILATRQPTMATTATLHSANSKTITIANGGTASVGALNFQQHFQQMQLTTQQQQQLLRQQQLNGNRRKMPVVSRLVQ